MRFFERPNLVTAVLLFLETLIVLFKLEYLLMIPFEHLIVALVSLILLPIGFRTFYKYILDDLEELKPVSHDQDVKSKSTVDSDLNDSNTHHPSGDSRKDCTK